MRSQGPTLKGTEVSLSYIQSLLYLVFSINVSIFHITCLNITGRTLYDFIWHIKNMAASHRNKMAGVKLSSILQRKGAVSRINGV